MGFLLGLVPSSLARWLIIAAVLAFGAAWCVHKGVELESNRRDAIDLRVQQERDASFGRALGKGKAAEQKYLDEKAKRAGLQRKLDKRADNANESDLAVSNCHAAQAAAAGPACVFTRYYVRLWDAGWIGGGQGAESVFGDPDVATPEERQPTALGPRDILKNEQANAVSCTDDRAKHDALIDLLDKLELEWESSHR